MRYEPEPDGDRMMSPIVGGSGQDLQEMLAFVARLRGPSAGPMDENAVQAVSEVMGVSAEMVRQMEMVLRPRQKPTLFDRWRESYRGMNPLLKRLVVAAWLGAPAGALLALIGWRGDVSGLFASLLTLFWLGALANAAVAKRAWQGAVAGAAAAGLSFLVSAFGLFVINLLPFTKVHGPAGAFLLAYLAIGGLLGLLASWTVVTARKKMGLEDGTSNRQQLLSKLQRIQEELRAEEKFVTFVSVDVAGSTRIKQNCNPLDAEYTFGEYHRYIEALCHRFGGRIHSTAGDGVTAAFDVPERAVLASRAMLSGLFEFNAFRNKTGQTFDVRIGIHCGTVMAPDMDVEKVNFASVIDLAAHFQKATDVGSLALSEAVKGHLTPGVIALEEETVNVDGLTGYVWRTKTRGLPATSGPAALN